MCGICAILNSSMDERSLRQLALKLSKIIRHRGPDWSGIHTQSMSDGTHSVLVHERLAIVDPSSGHQPLLDPTGTVCVSVNGEIYNHSILEKQKLTLDETQKIQSHSDCAIIPSLLKAYGTDCVSWLDGMFAFVSSDSSTGRIIAARDPLGVCPLYIGRGRDGSVWFASELKCLSDDCLSFDIFPPGHFYDSQLPGDKLVRYYNPSWWSLTSPVPTKPLDLGRVREAFEKAVHKRLMSDVPFGVLLSGGLDSSIVASILARDFKRRAEASGELNPLFRSVKSYAIGLKDSPDLKAARKVANQIGTDHQEFTFTVQEGIDNLRNVIYSLETYDVTTIRAATPLYLLSRVIRSTGVKFVLSGEGADEIFGGYLYFHKAPNATEFHRETQRKLHALHHYDVLRANKAPMAFGLEVRVPFLDKEFLDVAMEFDPTEKMCRNGRIEKWVLRSAFEGYLPADILWRQKEQFSDGVGYSWIDGLKAHAEEFVSDRQMEQAQFAFPHNTPSTKEAYFYRCIFHDFFPQSAAEKTVPGGPSIACSTAHVMEWDAEFKNNADQSGRSVIGIHQAAVDCKQSDGDSSSPSTECLD